jgi:hypothetical protein
MSKKKKANNWRSGSRFKSQRRYHDCPWRGLAACETDSNTHDRGILDNAVRDLRQRYHHNIRSGRWSKQPVTYHRGRPQRDGMVREPSHNRLWNGRYCDGDFIGSDLVGIAPDRYRRTLTKRLPHRLEGRT